MRSASSHSARFSRFEGRVSQKLVRSSVVLPFITPPARFTYWKCSAFFSCADPWNFMCPKRWGNPERRVVSLRELVLYLMSTGSVGGDWFSDEMHRSPFGRGNV